MVTVDFCLSSPRPHEKRLRDNHVRSPYLDDHHDATQWSGGCPLCQLFTCQLCPHFAVFPLSRGHVFMISSKQTVITPRVSHCYSIFRPQRPCSSGRRETPLSALLNPHSCCQLCCLLSKREPTPLSPSKPPSST